jgi:hypothetical protein
MSKDELKIQCQNRDLPCVMNEMALRIIIRGNKRTVDLSDNNDSLVLYDGTK